MLCPRPSNATRTRPTANDEHRHAKPREDERIRLGKLLNDPDMHDKFMGKIDFFDTSGILEPTEDPQAIAVPPTPGRERRKPRVPVTVPSPTDPGAKVEPLDALVRFIDIGVAPGKTYQYSFRVHMANPNFGKPDLVAYQGLAAEKELVSPFSYSPQFSIPTEFQYFAVDQQIDQQIQEGSDKQAARAETGWLSKARQADTSMPELSPTVANLPRMEEGAAACTAPANTG